MVKGRSDFLGKPVLMICLVRLAKWLDLIAAAGETSEEKFLIQEL